MRVFRRIFSTLLEGAKSINDRFSSLSSCIYGFIYIYVCMYVGRYIYIHIGTLCREIELNSSPFTVTGSQMLPKARIKKKKNRKNNEKYTGPFFSWWFFPPAPGEPEFIILFCNKTYFLHINSKPLTRFIVCMQNRIAAAVFGIVLYFYYRGFFSYILVSIGKRYSDGQRKLHIQPIYICIHI